MTVKVMLLKSGEDVISDAQEVRDKEGNSIICILFEKSLFYGVDYSSY